MAGDEATRARVVDAARELFASHGYGGTTESMVARRAGVSARSVRRLVGGPRELLIAVLADTHESEVADLVDQAAGAPERTPPLSALIEGAHRLFASPEHSWDPLELEVLARASDDADLRAVATDRIGRAAPTWPRCRRPRGRRAGIDPDLSDNPWCTCRWPCRSAWRCSIR